MKLQFIGANHEVTGSCHYLQAGDSYMLVDYGMEQGVNRFENCPLPVPESQINFVFLTHAHIDHSGMLPLLYAHGFRGKIYTTEATADLCSIMLRDCAHIQQQEAEWKSRKAKRHAGIEVENGQEKKSMCLLIRWRMRSAPSTVSYHARMGKNWK